MSRTAAARVPLATYRLHLGRERGFEDLAAIVPYFTWLGVDTLYLPPILLSAPGSTHGYDVSDHRRIDPELGGVVGFERLSERLRADGLGVLLDFVPNHMGIEGPFNTWWREVLEAGEDSPRARFFDIFWTGEAGTRIHLPVLEDHYGRVLEAGKLQLEYADGALGVSYGAATYPLSLNSYVKVLRPIASDQSCPEPAREALQAWLSECATLVRLSSGSRRRHAEDRARQRVTLKNRLRELVSAHADVGTRLDARLRVMNGSAGHLRSFDALHGILEQQHYRLARWQSGTYETNYRRFFAIDSLVGLRIENPDVFRDSHALVGQLIAHGHVHGLRIDHVDGLWDPHEYLDRLQRLGPEGAGLYVVVEKILAGSESLPSTWPVAGTTGYEFIDALAGLLVDPTSEERFSRLYAEFSGRRASYHQEAYASKRSVQEDVLPHSTAVLASRLSHLIDGDRRWRDLTQDELRIALRELMANLRVYRTYRRMNGVMRSEDRGEITEAVHQAMRRNPLTSTEVLEFVRDALTGDYPPPTARAGYRSALAAWALSVQQHTGAVMAKAVEDRVFYTFNRFVALNEVGGEPARFGRPVDDFHRANLQRLAETPHGLIATSTHDTKFGEDARARLYALSEIGEEWEAWVREWSALNRRHKTIIDGEPAPDANEEYRLYQSLLGVWPLEPNGVDDAFRERLRGYVRKCANEAHVHSAWAQPNGAWLAAGDAFVDAILTDTSDRGFLESVRAKATRVAELGLVNSLVQVTLKMTSPGVPDLYHGSETWSLTLVDPDNRRPADFGRLAELAERAGATTWHELLHTWRDGAIKLRLIRDLLHARAAAREVFDDGDYWGVMAHGDFADRIVAFVRAKGTREILVAVSRLAARFGRPPLGELWTNATIETKHRDAAWRDVLTGRRVSGQQLAVSEIFADLPVAVLVKE